VKGGYRTLLRLTAAAAGIAVLVWTISRLGPRRVIQLTLEADAWWLTLSLLPVFARYLIWGYKWQRMLCRDRFVSLRDTLRMLMAGCFINLTTPTAKLGGGVLRAATLHKWYGFGLSSGFGWVLADQVTNSLGGMLLFGSLALAGGVLAPGGSITAYVVSGGLSLLLFVAILAARPASQRASENPKLAAFFLRFTPARFRVPEKEGGTGAWLEPLLRPLVRRSGWSDTLMSTWSFAALCASNALTLKALGVDAPAWMVAIAVAVGYFAGNGLGPMGGIGVTEAAMTGVYLQLGINGEVAAAGVLLHRAGYYLVGLLWGGVALLRIGRKMAIPPPQA
jgi:uncharacterized membrane protein YbhN (UPF0104 family)